MVGSSAREKSIRLNLKTTVIGEEQFGFLKSLPGFRPISFVRWFFESFAATEPSYLDIKGAVAAYERAGFSNVVVAVAGEWCGPRRCALLSNCIS